MSTPSDLVRLQRAGDINYSVFERWTGASGRHLAARISAYDMFMSRAAVWVVAAALFLVPTFWCAARGGLYASLASIACGFCAAGSAWMAILASRSARLLRPELASAARAYCLLRHYSFFKKDEPFASVDEIMREGGRSLLDSGTYRHLDFACLHDAMAKFQLADPDASRYRGGIIARA